MATARTSSPVTARKPADRSEASRKKCGRAAITNGKELLPGVDGRSIIARRFRDIASQVLIDQGGADRCSESRQQLVRRFAAACVLAEEMEGRLARGEQIDISEHALLCSSLVRLAQRIGINRVPRTVADIGDYVAIDKVETSVRNDIVEVTE
jgi:hypothetical protein